jgi:hypothetical protein
MTLTLRSAEALDDYWLRLTLSDGTAIERNVRDLRDLLPVRHGTVEWPGDLELDPAVLIWNGPAPRGESRSPAPRLVLRHPTAQPTS